MTDVVGTVSENGDLIPERLVERIEYRTIVANERIAALTGTLNEILNSVRWNLRVQTIALIILAGVNVAETWFPGLK